ncbi:apoptosis facilitator Bcl-2-like protein 14 [Petromyzon marinus]|uniref:Apoptosis facilitator Bcl-2-like protein 14 n=1 Tax=Petromyzon marinus TaxID=7757 RepID=A0AAJ7T9P4_PETMA|nr:apoptosis facilitator Bcl-2-like protein 14 [Petromyzon marinus]
MVLVPTEAESQTQTAMEDDRGGGGGGGSNTGEPGGQGDSILSFKDETKKVLEMFLRRSLSAPEETAVGRVGGCYHSDYNHRHQRRHHRRQGNGSVVKRVQDTVDVERKDEFYEKVARQLERLANQHQLRTAQSHDVDSWVSPDGVPRPLPGTPIEGWRITPEPGPSPGEPLAHTRVERVAKPTPSPDRTLSHASAKDGSRVPRKDHKVPAGTNSGSMTSSAHRDCVEVDPDWMETHERINNAEEKKHGFKTRFKKLIRWESIKHGKKKRKKKKEEEEESADMMVTQGWSDRDEEMLRGRAHRGGVPLGEAEDEAEDEAEEEERRRSPPQPATPQLPVSGTGTVGHSGKTKWRGIGFFSMRRKSKAAVASGEPAPTSPRPSTLPLKNIFRPSKKKGQSAAQETVDIEKPEIDEKVTRQLERLANELYTAQSRHLESGGVPGHPPGTPVEERRSTLDPGPQLSGPVRIVGGASDQTIQGELRYGDRTLVQSVEDPRQSQGRTLSRALASDCGKVSKTDHKAAAGLAAAATAKETELQNETELIAELVTLLGLSGDALEKQIQQDVDLRGISYIFFCKFINAYITAETQDTTPSPEACRPVHVRAAAAAATPNKFPAADVADSSVVTPVVAQQPTPGSDASVRPPEVLQIALAMDLTKRMAGINQRAVTRIMGFGAQYLEERFSPWIMKQGGWHNILDPDSVSEFEVD